MEGPLTISADMMTPSTRRAGAKRSAWLVANSVALLAVAVALRVWRLDNIPGINGDEAWSGVQALRFLNGESVDWRTPHGNPMNLFLFLPLVALHAIFPPSFALLRVTALASGLAAVALNYFLCRRAFDARTATISTILLALLPIDIAYSRFGWDASQSLLATLFVMYLPLLRCPNRGDCASVPTWGMVALAAAILIHPTNVFAAPLLVVPAMCARRRQIVGFLQNATVGTSAWRLIALVGFSIAAAYGAWYWLAHGSEPLRRPAEWAAFVQNYLRLFSGTTVYEFIGGLDAGVSDVAGFAWFSAACNLAFLLLAIAALWGMACRMKSDPTTREVALVIGWLAMLCGFFIVAGPGAIAPHYERYGICLIAPAALVMSRGLAWWIDERQTYRRSIAAAMAAMAWLWPASFYWGYFEFIEQTGGRSHLTFRAAAVEPKLQAFHLILDGCEKTREVRIVCHDWWNYWPLAYLAYGDSDVQVLTWDEWQSTASESELAQPGSTWFVEFAGTQREHELNRRLMETNLKVPRDVICDYAGRDLLSVTGPLDNSFKNY
jgi:hypothetical protein